MKELKSLSLGFLASHSYEGRKLNLTKMLLVFADQLIPMSHTTRGFNRKHICRLADCIVIN